MRNNDLDRWAEFFIRISSDYLSGFLSDAVYSSNLLKSIDVMKKQIEEKERKG